MIVTVTQFGFSIFKAFLNEEVLMRNKIRLCKTIISTVVLYGNESWSLTARTVEVLDYFERKMLRWIYVVVCKVELWIIGTNTECPVGDGTNRDVCVSLLIHSSFRLHKADATQVCRICAVNAEVKSAMKDFCGLTRGA